MVKSETITVLATGDVCVNRDEPDSMFSYVSDVIKSADISFCQIETTYSERGTPVPHCRVPLRAHPRNIPSIKAAGFDVASFASNHALDWGMDAFHDTLNLVKKSGIKVVGAGKNIDEAREATVVDCKGVKIGFIAYNSILPLGYWADEKRPGCNPMRAWTVYEQVEHDQPGTPARIHSFANEHDKSAMIKDIEALKSRADVVLASFHWGIHFTEADIALYQKEVAYAALDAGADAILGHHAHILKPIEIYKGKPIFYSLCNFAFDLPLPDQILNSRGWKELMALNRSWTLDRRYRSYPFPADSRMSMACKIMISGKKIKRVSLLPVLINEDSQPRFLKSREKEFSNVLEYLAKIGKLQDMNVALTVKGDEAVIRM